jgi:hypothetical protein
MEEGFGWRFNVSYCNLLWLRVIVQGVINKSNYKSKPTENAACNTSSIVAWRHSVRGAFLCCVCTDHYLATAVSQPPQFLLWANSPQYVQCSKHSFQYICFWKVVHESGENVYPYLKSNCAHLVVVKLDIPWNLVCSQPEVVGSNLHHKTTHLNDTSLLGQCLILSTNH